MKIAMSADTLLGIAPELAGAVLARGHQVSVFGALATERVADWAFASVVVAKEVSEGRADMGIVCCTTGPGATIAANKVSGIRAALCTDAFTAAGARRWNDANVLGLSLRLTSSSLMNEMLDAWFGTEDDGSQVASLKFLEKLS